MNELTDRQQAILDFVAERLRLEGRPPTQAEVALAFGIQLRAAQKHLQALATKGRLQLAPGTARGIRLAAVAPAARRPDALSLPILGRVAAGRPIDAQADFEGQLLLDRAAFFPRPDFLLRVHGDSMRDDGILDGDLIAIKRSASADNGQIVVARIDGEITVKRLEHGRHGIRLLPRNPDYAPLLVPADADFAIEGLYCGLVRRA